MDVSYSKLRQNLKEMICIITGSHDPMFITSHKTRMAVLLSYDDYKSLEETAYLIRSPAMAKRLLEAVSDIKKGNVIEKDLIDET